MTRSGKTPTRDSIREALPRAAHDALTEITPTRVQISNPQKGAHDALTEITPTRVRMKSPFKRGAHDALKKNPDEGQSKKGQH